MSDKKVDRLVQMVNQIALNMQANGDENMVGDQVAQHLEKFWSPPMKNLISDSANDDSVGLTSISQKAVVLLAAVQKAKSS